jgi:hypothetical protein
MILIMLLLTSIMFFQWEQYLLYLEDSITE